MGIELTIRIIMYTLIVLSYAISLWLSILNYKNRNAPIPEEVKDIYDEEEYKIWHKYNMANFKFETIVKTLNTVLFILLLAIGFSLL